MPEKIHNIFHIDSFFVVFIGVCQPYFFEMFNVLFEELNRIQRVDIILFELFQQNHQKNIH